MSTSDDANFSVQEGQAGNESLENQIDSILSEDDITSQEPSSTEIDNENPTESQNAENQEKPDYPEEFLKSDGSLDVESLLKSYQELKPLADEKANWEEEKETLLKQAERSKQLEAQQHAIAEQSGFQNQEDMQLVMEIANAQANEYERFLHTVAEPDRVRGLLALYRKVPTPELLSQIEEEFSIDVIKRASIISERCKNNIQQRQNVQRYEQYQKEAKEFVSNAIKNYPEWFDIPEFVGFFKEALSVKGDAFETSRLIQHLENLKQVFRKQFLEEQKLNSENEKDKDLLKNLSPKANPKTIPHKRLEDYTDAELESAIEALV
jgi:hypothetical protein|nr:MAG TPA: hypothetical protein [Caudoviricetes sp.]